MTDRKCKLGDEHCEALNRVLMRIPEALSTCDHCEAAGIPMQEQRDMLLAQQKMATTLKERYFPNRL